jgi:formamidopyrimidine-DNA glycosylase
VPELPEVETVRQGLNQVTLQQPILSAEVLLDRTVAAPIASEFAARLTGSHLVQWHRRGKYLLAELGRQLEAGQERDEGQRAKGRGQQSNFALTAVAAGWLGVHLRMTGQLLWLSSETPLQKHCRVRFLFPNQQELRFIDQRTFGQMWFVPPDRRPKEVMLGLAKLGPEPFSPEFSVDYFADRLRDRHRPIKNALLDQSIVAGIGNIYADEALFLSRIQPQTSCAVLGLEQIARLHGAVIQVLQAAIAARGTTFSDYRDVAGINGNYAGLAWVYDREGLACRICETRIQRIKLAGRSAHFCPTCQP